MPAVLKQEMRELLKNFCKLSLRKRIKDAICKVDPKSLNAFCKMPRAVE